MLTLLTLASEIITPADSIATIAITKKKNANEDTTMKQR
jgi:hypothetical protein